VALTILDAGVVIAVLDADDVLHGGATAALSAALARDDAFAFPASAYAEAQVAPARRGRDAMRAIDEFLADLGAEVEPITRQMASRAALLRATHGKRLPLPDALVVAAALHLGADRVLTTDSRWPQLDVAVDVVGPA
jgi:predicted nucleic acid-binding protein